MKINTIKKILNRILEVITGFAVICGSILGCGLSFYAMDFWAKEDFLLIRLLCGFTTLVLAFIAVMICGAMGEYVLNKSWRYRRYNKNLAKQDNE